ncbi:MAG: OmpA family protein [Bacteroidota bacterium]
MSFLLLFHSMPRLLFVVILFINPLLSANAQDEQLIRSIYFGGGSWSIDEYQLNELYEFVDSIPDLDQYEIIIHSHTDNIGGKEYNQWLSKMRSTSVYDRLIMHEVPSEMMHIKDLGQFNPSYNNNSFMGRLRNRRVDIIFQPIVF